MRFFDRLKIRVFFPIFIVTGLAIFFGMGWLYYVERSQIFDMVKKETSLVTEVVNASIREEMTGHRIEEIQTSLSHIERKAGLRGITIVNGGGSVVFTSRKKSMGKVFPKTDITCTVCHSKRVPMERATITLKDSKGNRVFRALRSIGNDPECRSCHGNRKKVLGTLFVDQNMGRAMVELKGVRQTLLSIGIVSLFLVSCCIFLIIETGVLRPVYSLMEGVRRLALGKFDSEVHTSSRGEMKELLGAFNDMVKSVKNSIDKVEEKNSELSTLISMNEKVMKSADLEEVSMNALSTIEEGISQIGYSLLMCGSKEEGKVHFFLFPAGEKEVMKKYFSLKDVHEYREFINPEHVQNWASGTLTTLLATDGGSGIVLPLKGDDPALGLLYVRKEDKNQFSRRESTLLSSMGTHISVALENRKMLSRVIEEASKEERREGKKRG